MKNFLSSFILMQEVTEKGNEIILSLWKFKQCLKEMLTIKLKISKIKHRGQVLVLYALLIPFLLMFVGVGLDLGWYYLNVSRLQNAADAAAVAGAQMIYKNEKDLTTFKSLQRPLLTSNRTLDSSKIYLGATADEKSEISTANSTAKNYAVKNLGDTKEVNTGTATEPNMETWLIDSWSKSSADSDRRVEMNSALYNDGSTGFYFVVTLTEKIEHLFMPGWFDPMDAPVTAVALLTKKIIPEEARPQGEGAEHKVEGEDLLTAMYKLEDKSVTRNWEAQTYATEKQFAQFYNGAKKYVGNMNEYQDSQVRYDSKKRYRYEKAEVRAGSPNQGSSQGKRYNYTEEQGIDSLNLDFKADIQFKSEVTEWEDFDIVYTGSAQFDYRNGANSSSGNLRIHSTFNFTTPYTVRQNRTEEQIAENPEDALYVRIESEPIDPLPFKTDHRAYSSVRQIFLNINQSNTDKNYRPLVFFYDGPEKINDNSSVRDSQPVILTLNADSRVILFAPHSPVVIRGNYKTMQGFVIAKEFVQLTTESDYYQEDGRYFDSSAKIKEYFYVSEEGTFIDEVGNVQTKPLDSDASRDLGDSEAFDEGAIRRIGDESYERVYNLSAFNLAESSRYDSFNIKELKRDVYSYLDNSTSVDMFFTTMRASWID